MTISERINVYLFEHSLKQKEFAEKIGYSVYTVRKWQRGRLPNIFAAIDLARLFKITIDELIKDEKGVDL